MFAITNATRHAATAVVLSDADGHDVVVAVAKATFVLGRTVGPKSPSTSSIVREVSSGTSWSKPAMTVSASMRKSTNFCATAIGWSMYGTPLFRI